MSGAGLDPETGIIFEQVLLQGTRAQVTYTQPNERANPNAVLIRTLVVEIGCVPQEHADFIDALRTMTEEGLREMRSPPDQIFPRQTQPDQTQPDQDPGQGDPSEVE